MGPLAAPNPEPAEPRLIDIPDPNQERDRRDADGRPCMGSRRTGPNRADAWQPRGVARAQPFRCLDREFT